MLRVSPDWADRRTWSARSARGRFPATALRTQSRPISPTGTASERVSITLSEAEGETKTRAVPPNMSGLGAAISCARGRSSQDDLRRDVAGWLRLAEGYLLGRWHVADNPAPGGPAWRATSALGSAGADIAI